MFLVMDLTPNDGAPTDQSRASPEADTSATSWQSSSFLALAYTKARSMTGCSLTSTDGSSISSASRHGDSLESLDDDEMAWSNHRRLLTRERAPALEGIAETFYDCRSQAGSQSSLCAFDHDGPTVSNRDDEIAEYVNGMCVYADGTPAFAPPGCCVAEVSYDFEEFHDFDHEKARKMWVAMLKWREETEVWKIHTQPNRHFHISKKYYPSCYHGVDKDDVVVEFSFPGKMVPEKLFPTAADIDKVMLHHRFMQEYLFNCLYTHEETWRQLGKEPIKPMPKESRTRGIVLVIDVKDAGINLLSGNVFTFLKRMIHNSTSYYPAMAQRVILINSPFWVAGVFKTIKPLLPDELPVDIVSAKNTLSALNSFLGEENVPPEYGGANPYPLGQHPFERRLYEKVEEAQNWGNPLPEDKPAIDEQPVLLSKPSLDETTDACFSESTCSNRSTLSLDGEDSSKASLCSRLPSSQSVSHTQPPTFTVDSESEDVLALVLGPDPPKLDLFGATRHAWGALTKSCRGCT